MSQLIAENYFDFICDYEILFITLNFSPQTNYESVLKLGFSLKEVKFFKNS